MERIRASEQAVPFVVRNWEPRGRDGLGRSGQVFFRPLFLVPGNGNATAATCNDGLAWTLAVNIDRGGR